MPDRCSHCKQKFEIEPGFWYGAMYFSYLLGLIGLIPVAIVLYILSAFDFTTNLIVMSVYLVILIPLLFRYSRVFWIYIFIEPE